MTYEQRQKEARAAFIEEMLNDMVKNKISGNKPLACSGVLILTIDHKEYRYDAGLYRGNGKYSIRPSIWPVS